MCHSHILVNAIHQKKSLLNVYSILYKTEELSGILSNWSSLVDIPNHAVGMEDGACDQISVISRTKQIFSLIPISVFLPIRLYSARQC